MGETKMNYHKQLILCLVPGGRDANADNRTAYSNAQALSIKRTLAGDAEKQEFYTLTAHGTPDLSRLQASVVDNTRVYLVGHGTDESSSIGELDANALASMIKSLVRSPKKIARLGLVGCFSGLHEIDGRRPLHRLASELYPKVSDRVTEITGYTGQVGVEWKVFQGPGKDRIPADYGGRTVYAKQGTGHKVVYQQSIDGTQVPRKIIVDARGTRWAPGGD